MYCLRSDFIIDMSFHRFCRLLLVTFNNYVGLGGTVPHGDGGATEAEGLEAEAQCLF